MVVEEDFTGKNQDSMRDSKLIISDDHREHKLSKINLNELSMYDVGAPEQRIEEEEPRFGAYLRDSEARRVEKIITEPKIVEEDIYGLNAGEKSFIHSRTPERENKSLKKELTVGNLDGHAEIHFEQCDQVPIDTVRNLMESPVRQQAKRKERIEEQ